MNLPLLKILVIEDDRDLLDQISQNMSGAIANFERNDITVEIIEAATIASAISQIENDPDIQAVVLSWDVEGFCDGSIDTDQDCLCNNVDIVNAIKEIRVSVPIYILGNENQGLNIIDESIDIESFFFRDDIILDPESILGYILNDFDDRSQAPFWKAYKNYITETNDSWQYAWALWWLKLSEFSLHQ